MNNHVKVWKICLNFVLSISGYQVGRVTEIWHMSVLQFFLVRFLRVNRLSSVSYTWSGIIFEVIRSALSGMLAKVGCPASSLGFLTCGTREPISGEKTLAFSWVSYSHMFMSLEHWALSLYYLQHGCMLPQTSGDGGWLQWPLQSGGWSALAVVWSGCDG